MLFGTPLTLFITLLIYAVLLIYCRGIGKLQVPVDAMIAQYKSLGPVSTTEKRVAIAFVIQMVLVIEQRNYLFLIFLFLFLLVAYAR